MNVRVGKGVSVCVGVEVRVGVDVDVGVHVLVRVSVGVGVLVITPKTMRSLSALDSLAARKASPRAPKSTTPSINSIATSRRICGRLRLRRSRLTGSG